jgi:phosphatidylglycerophosphate synthase
MMGRRIHSGILNSLEAPAIQHLVPMIPLSVEPDHLSALALLGAGLAGAGLAACGFSAWFLPLAIAGLVLNWFGDSFDGALARFRRRERPRVGFLIDRCADTSAFCIIIFGLGLSPYLSFHAAMMLLVAYLLNNVYGLMKLVVDGVHVIGVGGIGATEGRLVIGLWAVALQVSQINLSALTIRDVPAFDLACAVALSFMLANFIWRVARDVERQRYVEQAWSGAEEARIAKFPATRAKVVPFETRARYDRLGRGVEELRGLKDYEARAPEKST